MIKELWKHISRHRKMQFLMVLVIMVFASIAEVVSIGLVVPFLGVLSSPEQIYQHSLMQPILLIWNVIEPNQLMLILTILFISAAIVSGVIRLVLLYVITRLSFLTGADLNYSIYRRTLYQDYSEHMSRNSSEIINGLMTKTSTVVNGVISPILTILSSLIMFIGIMSVLFFINITVAITSLVGFGLLYGLVAKYTRKKLKDNSICIAETTDQTVKILQEGVNGIRDVLIGGNQQFYCQIYKDVDMRFRLASADNLLISGSPRYVMEAIGMILIAGMAYAMSQQEGSMITVIPMLGAFALGAQRLLPIMQQLYGAYSSIQGSETSFRDVLKLLEQPLPDYANQEEQLPIVFNRHININKLNFRYSKDTPWILNNISLKIEKGSCVGFVGETGSGKSTLLDIIMGLLTPTGGHMSIDNRVVGVENMRSWQVHLAHVPQEIYLTDSTIEENIAFGVPKNKIDYDRVKTAAKKSKISESIENWPAGYQTLVGEQGVRLSGGQKQRIGIARALYQQADVLIFDEATSALDYKTELEVMKEIRGLGEDLTILIIAHRVSTLKDCDQVFELLDGEIKLKY